MSFVSTAKMYYCLSLSIKLHVLGKGASFSLSFFSFASIVKVNLRIFVSLFMLACQFALVFV